VVERIRPYLALIATQVRGQASYRTSFFFDLAGNVFFLGGDLVALLVMLRTAGALGGFDRAQVLVVFGLSQVAFSLADLAVGNIERLRVYVRTGLLDTVLVRPLGVLGQLLAMDIGTRRLGRLASSIGIFAYGLHAAGVHWTAAKAVLAVVAPVAGAVFFAAIFVATATVAFWWIESGELGNIVTYGGRDFTGYPVSIFGGWFRRVFAYALGMGFVAYYPSLALLGVPDPLGLPGWAGWAAPAAAPVAALAAGLVWRTGVRHYRSTGS
jgi:ABC-2 type transport system permease protein